MFIFCNPNPCNILVGDCSIRACSIATDQLWNTTHKDICDLSRDRCNMPSANIVWGEYLQQKGFKQIPILLPFTAKYTVEKFCCDHPRGVYVLGIGSHVVTVVDGDYYDIWDSGDQEVLYYFRKE